MAGHFYSKVVDSDFQFLRVDSYFVSLQRRVMHTIEEPAERLIEKGNWCDFDVLVRAVVQDALLFILLVLLTMLWLCQRRWGKAKILGFPKKILDFGEVVGLSVNDLHCMPSSAPSRGRVRFLWQLNNNMNVIPW